MATDNEALSTDFILTPSSLRFCSTLTTQQKQLFYKAIREAMNNLLPARLFASNGGVLASYWVIEGVRHENNLRPAELALLTLLYYMTNKGNRFTTRADCLSFYSPSFSAPAFDLAMLELNRRNYIIRSYTAPGVYSGKRGGNKKFLTLSPEGIQAIKDINKQVRDKILSFHTQKFKK